MANDGEKQVPVVLLGAGGVGRALIERILSIRELLRKQYRLVFQVVAILDSRDALLAVTSGGLEDSRLRQVVSVKSAGGRLGAVSGGTARNRAGGPEELLQPEVIVVDCTASEDSISWLRAALKAGARIVLCNKRPLSSRQAIFDELTRDPRRIRWETTVGSCLPVMTALNRILASGDRISRIVGTYSGTLGGLMSALDEGSLFSDYIRRVSSLGVTEPDPRDDLSGVDMVRKTLILARTIGRKLELKDIQVEDLTPPDLKEGSVEEFLQAAGDLDELFSQRVRDAKSRGRVLRYAAHLNADSCVVGPIEFPSDSPFGRLRGNDNLVEIYSEVFAPRPLTLQGRGGGVQATAAGILSDLVELGLSC